VFWQEDGEKRLIQRLSEAAERGADLALLPEIPLNPWRPATKIPVADDAEEDGGPRTRAMARAAREAGVGLVGGIISRGASGARTNRALVFNKQGEIVARYDKLHLPEEPGFWETSHYGPGDGLPQRIDEFGLPIGVQICSDVNRPQGTHLLGAQGVVAILAPRATERRTYDRWKLVLRSNAVTSCTYVLSVNRPDAEDGVLLGGPSVAIAPDGNMLVETSDPLATETLTEATVRRERENYPGYMPVRASLYAEAWTRVAARRES
jgi:N-carbamoylputrescine amidase